MKKGENLSKKTSFMGRFNAFHVGVVSALVVLIVANAAGFVYLWHQTAHNESFEAFRSAHMIVRAIDDLNKPVVTDIQSGKVYVPEARLVLPPRDTAALKDVQYSYYAGDQSPDSSEVHVISPLAVRNAESPILNSQTVAEVFDRVPVLQACARGVRMTYQQLHEGLSLSKTKVLSNGKTVYFYMEPQCRNDALLDYVARVDSY